MARTRRAVERAARRQIITDRVVVGILVVVAAAGLMSVLPAYTQVAVSRLACRVASLGLGACGAIKIDLENTQLAPARCATLGSLDKFLPEVRVEQVTTAQGLLVTIGQARSGDVFVQLGGPDHSAPPDVMGGEVRGQRELLPGVVASAQAEWLLPRGQGLDELVIATYDRHQRWVERRSALALLGSDLLGPPQQVPAPALLTSQVRLDQQRLPRFRDSLGVPRITSSKPPSRVPLATVDQLDIDPTEPATLVVNRITGESFTVAALQGVVARRPVTGSLRLARNVDGAITSLLIAVVSMNRLVPGEPTGSLPGPAVAYVSVPVRTEPERRLVQGWVSDPAGFTVRLNELLGLHAARPSDQRAAFLTRAATVVILRYGLVSPAELQSRVTTELRTSRRQDWSGIRMVAASSIAPQPSGGRRIVVGEPSCRT